MKLTKLIFLFALTLATVSCSKDDDNNEPYKLTTTNFVDTYKLKFSEVKTVEIVTFSNGTTSTSTTTTKGSSFGNTNLVFKADGTFAASGLYIVDIKTVAADGSTTTQEPLPQDAAMTIGSGTYSLNTTSNMLTITKDTGDVTAFDITKYNETEMRLYSEVEVTSNDRTITTTTEYRFSR